MDRENDKIKELESIVEQLKRELFQLQSVIDNLPASIYWKSREGAYLGFNKAGGESARKLNLPHTKREIIGKTDHEVFPKEMADVFRKNDLEVIQKGEESVYEEISVSPDGTKAVQLSTKKPLYDEDGNIIGVIGSTVDISYLKKIEAELREAKDKAEEANRLKMDFIHNMEHDIRTPFNGIYGMTDILWRHEKDEGKKEHLSYVLNASKELLDYCNSILDFSKIELGGLPLIDKKLSVKNLANKIIDMEMPAAKHKNIELTMSLKDVPSYVIGDEYRLMRILLNLTGNAIKFTGSGYVKLKISGHKIENRKIILKFEVEDSGIGIAEEKQKLISEKFTRLSPSNQGYYKGLGLGLPVVKQFVHDLDGELELNSKVNKGSKFTCVIPFKLPLLDDAND